MQIIWLIGVIAFIILEAVTYQMVSVWFVIGAIGGLITSLTGVDFWVQMTVFLALSLVLLICFRPIAVKKLKTDYKTNADAVIGKKVTITKETDTITGTGEGRLDGMVWTVRSESGKTLTVGDVAEVKKIEGVKLIVD